MNCDEDSNCISGLIRFVDSIQVSECDFDIQCGYEYFNNHSQNVSTISEALRQYEFVILVLKTLLHENLLEAMSQVYIENLIGYIQISEDFKNWWCILINNDYFPARKFYMETIKYELVQYNVHDCMYVLRLKCMNFYESDSRLALNVVHYFLSGFLTRSFTITPQVKWKFCGNACMTILWVVMIPKYYLDNFNGYRRSLLNESWNDFYGGTEWRPLPTKTSVLMDYVKKITGYKQMKNLKGNSQKKYVRRSNSYFETDDVVFTKFSDDKDIYIRRSIFSFSSFLIILFFAFLVRWYLQSRV